MLTWTSFNYYVDCSRQLYSWKVSKGGLCGKVLLSNQRSPWKWTATCWVLQDVWEGILCIHAVIKVSFWQVANTYWGIPRSVVSKYTSLCSSCQVRKPQVTKPPLHHNYSLCSLYHNQSLLHNSISLDTPPLHDSILCPLHHNIRLPLSTMHKSINLAGPIQLLQNI